MKVGYIIGIDEVGRGPLAGPVVVTALALPVKFKIQKNNLRDSKKLTEAQRKDWLTYIRGCPKICYSVARIYPRLIDKINISRAANLAAKKALENLLKQYRLNYKNCQIFLDGGLFVPKIYKAKTIIKGDEKIPAISLASIVAKIDRDELLKKYARKFKKYGFESHKGYGTRDHIKALKKYGIIKIHRLTFLKNYPKIILNR